MAALIFTLMPAFFGGELEAFARGFPPCILCGNEKKMPYGGALADKLSKRRGLSVKAVLGLRAVCNRKANVTLYQRFQGITFQIHSGRSCTAEALQQEEVISAELSRKQRLLEPVCLLPFTLRIRSDTLLFPHRGVQNSNVTPAKYIFMKDST